MPGLTFTAQEGLELLRKAAGRRRRAAATWRTLADAAATERQRQERLDWADQEDRLGLMLERMAEEEAERIRSEGGA